ncbi:MAG: hypothetical protein ACI9SQ_001208 [Rubritalea sp.]|jgi:hypothetical protein
MKKLTTRRRFLNDTKSAGLGLYATSFFYAIGQASSKPNELKTGAEVNGETTYLPD